MVERVMVILLNLGIWLLITLSSSELLKHLAKFEYLVVRGIREGENLLAQAGITLSTISIRLFEKTKTFIF